MSIFILVVSAGVCAGLSAGCFFPVSILKQDNKDVAWCHIQPEKQGNKEWEGGGQNLKKGGGSSLNRGFSECSATYSNKQKWGQKHLKKNYLKTNSENLRDIRDFDFVPTFGNFIRGKFSLKNPLFVKILVHISWEMVMLEK